MDLGSSETEVAAPVDDISAISTGDAAGPNAESTDGEHRGQTATTTSGDSSCLRPNTLPPGYLAVTVRLPGQSAPAVEDVPIEVLPCHTFADVCAAALARAQEAPTEYGIEAYLLLGQLEVPLQDPHTPARDTLRTFPGATALRFDLVTHGSVGAAASRVARASRVGPRGRQQRRWAVRLAKVAVGVAKLVLAVEAVALLSGSFSGLVPRILRTTGWFGYSASSTSSGSEDDDPPSSSTSDPDAAGAATGSTGRGSRRRRHRRDRRSNGAGGGRAPGSETEAALDAVAEYVSGRGELESLSRHDGRRVLGALQVLNAMDTEVLEQLDVPNVAETRVAVSSLLQELKQQEQEAQGKSRNNSVSGVSGEVAGGAAAADAGSTQDGQGGETAGTQQSAEAPAPAQQQQQPLPGFGPPALRVTGGRKGGEGRS